MPSIKNISNRPGILNNMALSLGQAAWIGSKRSATFSASCRDGMKLRRAPAREGRQLASALFSWLQRCRKLLCRLAELHAVLIIERIARGQRSGELGENLR